MQISVMLNNFRQPFEEALDTAAQMEIPAVQLTLDVKDDAQAMARAAHERGLAISAISCDVGDLGEEDAPQKIEAIKPLIDAAAVMGNGICQTHVGVMPHNAAGPRWDSFVRSGEALATYAQSVGACVALETGPEPAWVVEKLMKTVNSPGLGVNYDPANFILWPALLNAYPDLLAHSGREAAPYEREKAWAEFEPVEGVKRLSPFIVHTHAKDAIGSGGWEDVPLGEGWIDWPHYLGLLKDSGFDGYVAIEREGGSNRIGEIGDAVRFLRQQLRQLEQQ